MNKRIKDKGSEARVYNLTYKYGTHFAFPQKLLDMMLPVFGWLLIRLFKSGKIHGKECKQTRIDIENTLAKILYDWKN